LRIVVTAPRFHLLARQRLTLCAGPKPEPGGLGNTYTTSQARNWKEFRDILIKVWGPAQNAVYADVDGNIGYHNGGTLSLAEKRIRGGVPSRDTDDYESATFPRTLRKLSIHLSGIIVTANARVVGPKYIPILTTMGEPYRHRANSICFTIGMICVPRHAQSSSRHLQLSGRFHGRTTRRSIAHRPDPKTTRTNNSSLSPKDWNGIAATDTPVRSLPGSDAIEALRLILERYLGSDTDLYRWRKMAFLQKVLTDVLQMAAARFQEF